MITGKIVVTGATGTVGSAVVRSLKKKKSDFVAAVRDPEKAKAKLGSDVATVAFNFADPSTYESATQGVATVMLIGPPADPTVDQLITPFVHHLQQKNIRRVVYLSAFGAELNSAAMPFHTNMEEKLREAGFVLTILRPTFFAQNFKNYEGDNIIQRKITYSPAGSGKASFVDIEDVGEVAAKVLTEPGHEGKAYVLTGPESLSYAEVARLLSTVRKEPIAYPAPTPEEYTQTLRSFGAPDFIATYMNNVYGLIRDGSADYISPSIEQLLGRQPGKLLKVLEKELGN